MIEFYNMAVWPLISLANDHIALFPPNPPIKNADSYTVQNEEAKMVDHLLAACSMTNKHRFGGWEVLNRVGALQRFAKAISVNV
jgi:hypothetical protein